MHSGTCEFVTRRSPPGLLRLSLHLALGTLTYSTGYRASQGTVGRYIQVALALMWAPYVRTKRYKVPSYLKSLGSTKYCLQIR